MSSLWKNDSSTASGSSLDQSRSRLGTEQWGRESGGAPWGSTSADSSAGIATISSTGVARSCTGEIFAESWGGNKESFCDIAKKEKDTPETSGFQKGTSQTTQEAQEEQGQTRPKTSSLNLVTKIDPCEQKEESSGENESSKKKEDKSLGCIETDANAAEKSASSATSIHTSGQVTYVYGGGSSTVAQQNASPAAATAVNAESAEVNEAANQLQSLSVESYVAQQQHPQGIPTIGAYNLAMQQHHPLTAQQPHLMAAGMYHSYVMPSAPGYGDPNQLPQFPTMVQYQYPGYPTMYPLMVPQHNLTAASAATAVPTSAGQSSQANHSSTDTERSGSDTPVSQSQDSSSTTSGQQPAAEVVPGVAAMQQGGNFNMAAFPGYSWGFYDQTGALIINNAGRAGGPMRLLPPPFVMNGSHASAMFANQQIGAGVASSHGPTLSQSTYTAGAAQPAGATSYTAGSTASLMNLSSLSSSTSNSRRESFAAGAGGDYSKYGGGPANVVTSSSGGNIFNPMSLNPSGPNVSPSPGPMGRMMATSHHLKSPPPPNSGYGFSRNNRLFSATPGGDAGRYRGGVVGGPSNLFGASGGAMFPPSTRSRPSTSNTVVPGRSKLLDDFRNNRLPSPQLSELVEHIVEFSQDQHGSRFIQQKLERASLSEKQRVFNEIIQEAFRLMTDVFGNYVIQKFFEFGSREQKLELANQIQGRVIPLALQMYGCRVIQKALESIQQEQQVEIVKELDGSLLKCVKDQNGNHVVQKCIECVPPAHLQFIVDGFKGQVCGLSSHPYGCRVMQRILEHCTEDQTAPILEELHQHTEVLVKDQYGNYVIQHILEHGRCENKTQIVSELRGKILALSQHKFASNVIEKCVTHASFESRACLIEEVCSEPDALFIMMKDQYANYVVQKMLDVADTVQRKALVGKIRPHVINLRKFTYGKHIITKLEKYVSKDPSLASGASSIVGNSSPASSLRSAAGSPVVGGGGGGLLGVDPRDVQQHIAAWMADKTE